MFSRWCFAQTARQWTRWRACGYIRHNYGYVRMLYSTHILCCIPIDTIELTFFLKKTSFKYIKTGGIISTISVWYFFSLFSQTKHDKATSVLNCETRFLDCNQPTSSLACVTETEESGLMWPILLCDCHSYGPEKSSEVRKVCIHLSTWWHCNWTDVINSEHVQHVRLGKMPNIL